MLIISSMYFVDQTPQPTEVATQKRGQKDKQYG